MHRWINEYTRIMDSVIENQEKHRFVISEGDRVIVHRGGETYTMHVERLDPAGEWGQVVFGTARRKS